MKLKYLFAILLLGVFSGCDEEKILESITGGAIEIPLGIYATGCIVNGAGSSITYLSISDDPLERTIQVEVYAGDTTCDTVTDDGISSAETAEIELAKLNFGNNTSYLTEGDGVKYIPYHVDGDNLYLGVSLADISGATPESLFGSFIADPVGTAEVKFTLQVN